MPVAHTTVSRLSALRSFPLPIRDQVALVIHHFIARKPLVIGIFGGTHKLGIVLGTSFNFVLTLVHGRLGTFDPILNLALIVFVLGGGYLLR